MIFSICPLSIVGPTRRLFICPDIIWTLAWGPSQLNKIMCSMTNYVARNILWLPLIMMSSSAAASSIFRVLYLPPHSLHRGVEDDRCTTPGTLFITKRWLWLGIAKRQSQATESDWAVLNSWSSSSEEQDLRQPNGLLFHNARELFTDPVQPVTTK